MSETPPVAMPAPPRSGPGGLPAVTYAWWEALLAFIVGNLVLGGATYAVVAGQGASDARAVTGAFTLDIVFLGALLWWLGTAHPGSPRAIGVGITRKAVGVGAGLGVVLYGIIAFAVGGALLWVLERVAGAPVEVPEQVSGDLTGVPAVLAVVLAVVLAPLVEELYFRGILYRSVRDRFGVLAGTVVSSVLFGAVHLIPADGASMWVLPLVMTVTGVALAIIYERSANLVVPVTAHMAFNAIGITLILTGLG